jgi:cyanophycinase
MRRFTTLANSLWFALLMAGIFITNSAVAQISKLFEPDPKGSLIIVGGGDTPTSVQDRFINLAGGSGKARIAIFPMASQKSDEEAQEVLADFQKLGAEAHVVIIDKGDTNSEAIAEQLKQFSGYWFSGGDQSRLASLLVGTKALETIDRRYREGAVIGGTSAGASVMSSMMLTGRWRKATNSEEEEVLNIARGMKEVAKGFGIFKGAIVDQHFMYRARYNRLISAVLDHPELIGVGIDEETALLVRPDGVWEVLGTHYVKIFDARKARIIDDDGPMAKASDIRMHVIPEGGIFNPRKRKVTFQAE